jgi:hypothetical protein
VSGGELPINGADAGNLDEEAERRAFQAAVMEWRNGGATTEKGIKTMSIRGGSSGTGTGNDGMWNNPFADPSPSDQKMASGDEDALDEEAERRAFQAAVMEWRNSGKTTAAASTLDDSDDNMTKDDSGLWTNPYAPSKSSAVGAGGEDEESYVISSARSERNLKSSGGRSLADGMLDEQREQAVGSFFLSLLPLYSVVSSDDSSSSPSVGVPCCCRGLANWKVKPFTLSSNNCTKIGSRIGS